MSEHPGYPRVQGDCPSCGRRSLFLGDGGYITCSNLSCANPCSASEALGVEFPTPAKEATS